MMIAPEQAQFMALLTRLLGVRRYLEIGTYTGYSALAVALAMEADGRVVTCEIDEAIATTAKRHWRHADIADKIELRLGPALEALDAILAQGRHERFDMAFIDADKENYIAYYERLLELLRPGGLIIVDNVLWGGSVADPTDQDKDTVAIRAFNEHVRQDERIVLSLVPMGDGLTLALKR